MINRTLIRTKVVQTLFAYYKHDDDTLLNAKKELLHSFDDVYCLYMLFLDFVNEMVSEAEDKLQQDEERSKVTHTLFTANTNFINNRFASQIFNNRGLRAFIDERHLGWDAAHESLKALFKDIAASQYYSDYMSLAAPTYEEDKMLWRKIFTSILPDNANLEDALQELEIALDHRNWVTDTNIVLSFVIKTVKRFSEDSTPEQALLPMFDSENDLNFAKDLLQAAIKNKDEYTALIESHLKNWDINRIAYIDLIIMQVAVAELLIFPNIPIQVTLNEYLEIAKEYSTPKSHIFINGVLDELIRDLKNRNELIKAVAIN